MLLGVLLAAIMSGFQRLFGREECHNEISTAKWSANGKVTLAAEVTISTRYLLVGKGTAADGIILNVAATRPLGVCMDEPTSGNGATVSLLGSCPGTLPMRASKAIAAGVKVWTTAGGKVTDTYAAGAYFVGRNGPVAAAADGDLIVVQHCFPMLDASGTTL